MTESPPPRRRWITPTIPARFVRELTDRLPLAADTLRRIHQRAGIDPRLLEADEPRVAPIAYRRLQRLAVGAAGDEFLGHLARPVPPGTTAELLRLLAHMPSTGHAIDGIARMIRVFDGAPPWRIDLPEGPAGPVRLHLTPRNAVQADALLMVHLILLGLIHVIGWLAGEAPPLRRVMLPDRFAALAAESAFLFGRPVEHGAMPGGLEFGPGSFALPVTARPDGAGAFTRRLVELMTQPTAPAGTEAALRHLLAATRPYAGLSETAAARALGLSRATLARRLASSGMSFRLVRDELRRDLACSLLRRTELSLADIAERLGFSEPSAFQRAFRQWTGQPPARWRRLNR
ncbi:AraC family transcriptional regulator ligand-binding domain-containing protein (plasmid) [Tistrella mobilis]|uniref:helix-turn-helix domain-containing protein n=1 Tax=Tistrella mobilis TaxID=171437 RepID=UPI003556A036